MDLKVLTDAMDEAARETWFNLAEARRLGMRMGEETITELNLLALARALRLSGLPVEIVPTKSNEDTTGVDFEIWVNGPRVFGYSIQAKVAKAKARAFSYPHLAHKNATKTAFQYELLQAHALTQGSRAVHVFYNGWDLTDLGAPATPVGWDADLFGCAAVMTSVVRDVREKSTTKANGKTRSVAKADPYLAEGIPWSELFKVPPGAGSTSSSSGSSEAPPGSPNGQGPADGPDGSGGSRGGGGAPDRRGPSRPASVGESDLDRLDREAARRESHAAADFSPPRRPQELPEYVRTARGRRREDLASDAALPRFALVIDA